MNTTQDNAPIEIFQNLGLIDKDRLYLVLNPIYKEDSIIEFKIQKSYGGILEFFDLEEKGIHDKGVTSIFPSFLENGIFEILKACATKLEFEIEFEREFDFQKKMLWLSCKVISSKGKVYLIAQDISKLKFTENKLRSINEQLEYQNQILKDSENVSKTGSFRYLINANSWKFSENFYNLFDLDKHQIHSLEDILPSQDYENFLENVRTHKFDDVFPAFSFILNSDQDTEKFFKISANFVPTAKGQLMLGVIQDLTDDYEKERLLHHKNVELKRINVELESFTRIASHDLQEPLRKVQMFVSMIREHTSTVFDQRGEQYFDKINESVKRLQRLIKNLLTYSSLDIQVDKKEYINLTRILERNLEDIHDKEHIQVTLISDQDYMVLGIEILLNQLFYNLISNAVKYRKKDEALHIEAKISVEEMSAEHNLSNFYVRVDISDNGIGFDMEHKDKIFQLFQRLHTKKEYEGTGLGLAISQKIVETHKGFIEVNSKLNQGTTFSVFIPYHKKLTLKA